MQKKIELDGYKIDCVDSAQFVELAMTTIERGQGGWVWTPNVDMFRHCHSDPNLNQFIQDASIVIADGMPLVWAARLQGTPLPERVAGSSSIWLVCEEAAERGHSIFFLGGGEVDTAIRASAILSAKYPKLKVAGTHFPPFGFEKDEAQVEQIVEVINASQPDIVFVALSFPKGEYLTNRIRSQCNPALWMGVGISFSFITEDVQRAPVWMQKTGLEWIHRLTQEPRRLYKRYLFYDIPFGLGILIRALQKRFRSDHKKVESSTQ